MSFRPVSYAAALARARSNRQKPRSKLKPAGKKTKAWDTERASLKVRFQRAGITVCELQYPGCWNDNSLGFAHAKKRANIKPGELGEVILACSANCHAQIERLKESEMTQIVRDTIAGRQVQP